MIRLLILCLLSLQISASDRVNAEILSELDEMIMGDKASQALIVSYNGEVILEKYGEGFERSDFVTSQSIAKAFYAVLFGVAIEKVCSMI